MPKYQVKSQVNSQTINTDLECSSKDNAINFYKSLSVAEIIDVKQYVYINPSDIKKLDNKKYRYATVTVNFTNTPFIKVKIPKLKDNKNQRDIEIYFRSIYRNISSISISIRDTF